MERVIYDQLLKYLEKHDHIIYVLSPFSDDVKIFYTSDDINDIESVMNCEMSRVLNYYSINKLSVNMKDI